jgi:hypoxanthine phosphoribosyltransferase
MVYNKTPEEEKKMSAPDTQPGQGIRPVSWNDFHGICKGLALAIADYEPEMILGVARGGLYPGTLLAHILQKEFFPIRLTRRVNDLKMLEHPVWLIKPPGSIHRMRVLIVDEFSGTGETLAMAREEVLKLGASQVRCAVLYSQTAGRDIPDYIGLISDDLIMNPWDREILRYGEFIIHPEYSYALLQQGVAPGYSLAIEAGPVKPAKGGG